MPKLPGDHVHLWCLTLDYSVCDLGFWASLLCADERARADCLRHKDDRNFFIWYRGNLRRILASYLGATPQALRYRTGPFGKPQLAEPFDDYQLRFSISHSGNRVIIAVARKIEVGVDIEQVRPMSDLFEVADSVFSAREQSVLHSLKESDRLLTFFSVWAQKEAYLKARGFGLNRPPQDVEVGMIPFEKARLIHDLWDAFAADRWSLTAWLSAEGYAVALATEGHGRHIDHITE